MLEKVYAQSISTTAPHLSAFSGATSLTAIFNFILNLLLGVGWGLVVIMVALGFIQYITSQGDKSKVETAQKWLTYAVIGGLGLAITTVIKAILMTWIGANNDDFGNV